MFQHHTFISSLSDHDNDGDEGLSELKKVCLVHSFTL